MVAKVLAECRECDWSKCKKNRCKILGSKIFETPEGLTKINFGILNSSIEWNTDKSMIGIPIKEKIIESK